jgi:UDP-glucose 4-epimerase
MTMGSEPASDGRPVASPRATGGPSHPAAATTEPPGQADEPPTHGDHRAARTGGNGRINGVARLGTVLVTGGARYLGAQVAARLAADPRIDRVIAVDGHEPPTDLATLLADTVEVVTADLTTGAAAELIGDERVTAVVHLAVAADPHAGGRAVAKEQNVIGTMQLLAACQQAPAVRKLVVRSSTAAYGASFQDPAVFTEDTEPRDRPRGGFARDVLDIEGYLRGFCRRRPDVKVTVLRFAPFIGRRANTRLTRYFANPVVPTVFGRDPRLQFIHVDDALEILHRSVVEEHPGTFNVAGPGVITLSQAVRRAGRLAVPVLEPGMSAAAGLARGLIDFSLDQLDLFVHGRVVDTGRLVTEFGFTPRTTSAAFADFLRGTGGGALPGDAIRTAERAVLDGIRQARAALAAGEPA